MSDLSAGESLVAEAEDMVEFVKNRCVCWDVEKHRVVRFESV